MSTPVREIALGLAVLGLVAWLALDNRSKEERASAAIEKALATGAFGGLDDQQARIFRDTTQALLRSAGVGYPLNLNRPLSRKALNVYTVARSFQALPATRQWRSGNAVFQPGVGAIFLDLTLVQAAIASNPIDSSYFASAFLFLHELGHKVLNHGSGGTLLDAGRVVSSNKAELAADTYAIEKLKQFYSDHVHKMDEATFLKEYGFPPPPDNTPTTIYSNLRSVGFWTAVSELSQITPQIGEFSVFRFDRAHPALLERLLEFLMYLSRGTRLAIRICGT